MLETIPVKTEVDHYIGIDYSLIDDPVVTSRSLDMHFRGCFFGLSNPNDTLVNYAIDPVIREYDRMVYLALSEFFFDSGMFSYYKAGIFQMHIVNEKMPKDLEMLLRTTYFGAIMMLNRLWWMLQSHSSLLSTPLQKQPSKHLGRQSS
ncbi:hypothetical protein INR49_001242 [Caranx melampygus]|nr:hypothetical protein INR49_001242 [Caranx melampygus]